MKSPLKVEVGKADASQGRSGVRVLIGYRVELI